MKKQIFIGAMLICGMMFIANQASAQVQETPCSVADFDHSTALYGWGTGVSRDQQEARSEANDEAMADLAGNVEELVKKITTRGKIVVKKNEDDDVYKLTVGAIVNKVNKTLTNTKVVCEKKLIENTDKGSRYRFYIVKAYDKVKLEKEVYNDMQEENLLKVGTTFKLFEKEFEDVMAEMNEVDVADPVE